MAFENINWAMLPQAAQNRQANFMNALAQGIAMGERAQDRDLRQRQLEQEQQFRERQLAMQEAKMAQPGAANYKQMAMDELARINMGGTPTPEGQTAIRVMQQTTAPTTYVTPEGYMGTKPSPWQNIPLNVAMAGEAPSGIAGTMVSPEGMPRDQIRAAQADVSAVQPVMTREEFDRAKGVDEPEDLPTIEAPEGAGPNVRMAAQKATIDLRKDIEKAEREAEQKIELEKPKEEFDIKSSIYEAGDINSLIDDLYKRSNVLTTGAVGNLLSALPGTPQRDFAEDLKTLEADAGLSKLVEVKERGGTFGALQEKELELLIASRAALSQSQSPAQFKKNLIRYKTIRNRVVPMLTKAYKEKHGEELEINYRPQATQEQKRARLEYLEKLAAGE